MESLRKIGAISPSTSIGSQKVIYLVYLPPVEAHASSPLALYVGVPDTDKMYYSYYGGP